MAQARRVNSDDENTGRLVAHKSPTSRTEQTITNSLGFAPHIGNNHREGLPTHDVASKGKETTERCVLNQLEEFIQSPKCLAFNNKTEFMPPISQMANSSSSVHNPPGTNLDSTFQLSPTAEHSPRFVGNKSAPLAMNLPPSHINNQMSSTALDPSLPTTQLESMRSATNSIKLPPSQQHGQGLMPQPNQYNQCTSRQDMLHRHGYPPQVSRSLSLPSRPGGMPSHYGSFQRYMSPSSSLPQQTRPIPSQTPPRYPSGYPSQDILNSHGVQRPNSASDGNIAGHYQWPPLQQQLAHSQSSFPSSPGHNSVSSRSQGMTGANYELGMGMVGNHQQQSMMHSQYPSSSHTQQQPWLPPGLKPQMQAQQSYQQQTQYGMSGSQHGLPGQVPGMMQKSGEYGMYAGQQQQHQYPQQYQEDILRERNRKYQQAYQQQQLYLQQQQQQQQQTHQQQQPPHILPKPPPSGDLYNSQYPSKIPQGASSGLPEYPNAMVEERNSSSFPGSSESVNHPGSMPHLQSRGYPSLGGFRNSQNPSPSLPVDHSPMRSPYPETEKTSRVQPQTYPPYSSSNSGSYMPPNRSREPLPPYNIAVNRSDLSASRTPEIPVPRGTDIAVSRVPDAHNRVSTGSRRPTEGMSQQNIPFPHRPPSLNADLETVPETKINAGSEDILKGQVPSPTINDLPTAEDVEAMIESVKTGALPLLGEQDSITNNNKDHDNSGTTPAASMDTDEVDVKPSVTTATTTSTPTSPSDSFNVISPPGSPSGVSLSSLDDDFTLGSLSPWSQTPSRVPSPAIRTQTTSPLQYDQIVKVYSLPDGGEKRKQFLDSYLAFMEAQGSPVSKVPLVGKQVLDLFKLYTAVKERGGIQEVVKKKQWKEIVQELNIPSTVSNPSYFLHSQYMQYLMHYESKGDATVIKKEDTREIKTEFFSETETPPPNTTVTSKEEVIVPRRFPSGSSTPNDAMVPSPLATIGHSSFGGYSSSEMMMPRPNSYSQGYPGEVPERGYGAPMNQMSSHSSSMQQSAYPYSDMMRYGLSTLTGRNYPMYQQQQANAYGPQRPLAPRMPPHVQQQQQQQQQYTYQQQQQQQQYNMQNQHMVQGHPMYSRNQNQTMHEPMPPHWPQQYYPNQESEYQYERMGAQWPPGNMGPTLTQHHLPTPSNPYGMYTSRPHGPFGYRTNMSPRMSPSGSMSAQHEAAAAKAKGYPPRAQTPVKREPDFPPDCVESTKPVFTKRRKLASRDLGPVEAWRVMMSLKSGLLAETTWALDVLNILLYDDHTIDYFLLARLPGLLDNLVDHYRRAIIEIFGLLQENEIDCGAVERLRTEPEVSEEEASIFEELWVGRDLDSQRSWSCFVASHTTESELGEGFESGSSDWHLGGGDLTLHIQTQYETEPELHTTYPFKLSDKENTSDKQIVNCNMNCKETDLTNSVDMVPSPNIVECKLVKNEPDVTPEIKEEEEDAESKDCNDVKTEEDLIQKLKEEMDLDIESISDDEETTEFLERVLPSSSKEVKVEEEGGANAMEVVTEEDESNTQEDLPLCLRTSPQEALTRRCVSIANVIRGLSFVPGNDGELGRHAGLLLIFSKLLLLHHKHSKRVQYQDKFLKASEARRNSSTQHFVEEWWRDCLEALRENALVTLANVAGQLDITFHPEVIHIPILKGLIHWCVCQSSAAVDPMYSSSSLSPRQLSVEALAKMSILRGNVDLITSSLESSHAGEFFGHLVKMLGDRNSQVNRELSLVLLSNLSQIDRSCIELSKHKSCIQLLLGFLEDAESTLATYAQSQSGFRAEEFCGTTLGMLRRAAQVLVGIAKVKNSSGMFLSHQDRLLSLATSAMLDNSVVSLLDEVLFFTTR